MTLVVLRNLIWWFCGITAARMKDYSGISSASISADVDSVLEANKVSWISVAEKHSQLVVSFR